MIVEVIIIIELISRCNYNYYIYDNYFFIILKGVKPKSEFLKPDLLFDLIIETGRQVILQYVLGYKPLVPDDIGKDIVNKYYDAKTNK